MLLFDHFLQVLYFLVGQSHLFDRFLLVLLHPYNLSYLLHLYNLPHLYIPVVRLHLYLPVSRLHLYILVVL